MFTDFENATEIYAQLNLPLPFFSKVQFKANEEISVCVSHNLYFFIHTANQADMKKLDTFHCFKIPKVHQMIGNKHYLKISQFVNIFCKNLIIIKKAQTFDCPILLISLIQ